MVYEKLPSPIFFSISGELTKEIGGRKVLAYRKVTHMAAPGQTKIVGQQLCNARVHLECTCYSTIESQLTNYRNIFDP